MREVVARDNVVNHVNSQMAKYNSSQPNLVVLSLKRNSLVHISAIKLSLDRIGGLFVAFGFFYHFGGCEWRQERIDGHPFEKLRVDRQIQSSSAMWLRHRIAWIAPDPS